MSPHRASPPGAAVLGEPGGRPVPEATIVRLAVYLRALCSLAEGGATVVSSEELATVAGVGSAKLRKDLSFLGSHGTRGVGYDVSRLVARLELTLGLDRAHVVAVVGAGNLGRALVGYDGFARRGFTVGALFDADPDTHGGSVLGVAVHPIGDLDPVCRHLGITIGVVAVPAEGAQDVCDRLVAAGTTCVLNFAPVVLATPPGIQVRQVDLAAELQVLSFHLARRAAEVLGDGSHEIDPAAGAGARDPRTKTVVSP